jgi:hypothetical protein
MPPVTLSNAIGHHPAWSTSPHAEKFTTPQQSPYTVPIPNPSHSKE